MQNKPLVSIVVINYNNGRYLPQCMDSLLAQTYQNIEIVAVDALSTDDSRSILTAYAAKDQRIKLVFTEKYEPFPAVTYNYGFLNSSGDFIAVADSDDISLSHRIELQVNYLLSHPDVGVCGTNCREFNENQDILVETTVEKNVRLAAPPARNPTLMLRKDCLARFGLFNWKCEYAADFEWLYRFYSNGIKFHILEESCLMYRYAYGGNVSVTKRLNQSLKLAALRTYFGVKLFNRLGFSWWRVTFRNYLSCAKQIAIFLRARLLSKTRDG